jgi:hypothetical protein
LIRSTLAAAASSGRFPALNVAPPDSFGDGPNQPGFRGIVPNGAETGISNLTLGKILPVPS